jgi:hypothetical protein
MRKCPPSYSGTCHLLFSLHKQKIIIIGKTQYIIFIKFSLIFMNNSNIWSKVYLPLKYPEERLDWKDEDGTLLVLEDGAASSCLVFLLDVAPEHLLAAARFRLRTSPKSLLRKFPLVQVDKVKKLK